MPKSTSSLRTFKIDPLGAVDSLYGGACELGVPMNIISWNVRGLGKPAKRFLVKDFLNMHYADICCLQESKLDQISPALWREIGGRRLDEFYFIPARGSAGGIIIGWNSAILSGAILFKGTFSLTMEFYSKNVNVTWRCTTV